MPGQTVRFDSAVAAIMTECRAMTLRDSISATITMAVLAAPLSIASAQNRNLQQRLQSAVRVDCSFTQTAKGEWSGDSPGFSSASTDFTVSFVDIDVETGTADAEGRFGASYIIVRYAEGYLHFMQTMSAGPIYLTTIFAQPMDDGSLQAVHTRHEYTQVSLPGFTSRPEMYLGACTVETASDD